MHHIPQSILATFAATTADDSLDTVFDNDYPTRSGSVRRLRSDATRAPGSRINTINRENQRRIKAARFDS